MYPTIPPFHPFDPGKTCDPVNLCDSFGVAAEAAARYVTCFRSCDEHATARHLR